MNTIREIQKINQEELDRGIAGTSASWHAQYQNAPWVYVGNLAHELTEGDIISVMSQFGEIEDVNLVRNEDDGKSRGFAFLKYEDARSCVLAVDNFAGVKLCGRPMRVDHVERYRLPKKIREQEEAKDSQNLGPGHAYQDKELANQYSLQEGQDLFAPSTAPRKENDSTSGLNKQERKNERDRKRREKEERKRRREVKRMEREERSREKRARRMRHEDEGSERRRKHRRHHSSKRKHRKSRSPSVSSKSE